MHRQAMRILFILILSAGLATSASALTCPYSDVPGSTVQYGYSAFANDLRYPSNLRMEFHYADWVNRMGGSYRYFAGPMERVQIHRFSPVHLTMGSHYGYPGRNGALTGQIAESVPVPEPTTMLLLGFGFLGLAGLGRKMR